MAGKKKVPTKKSDPLGWNPNSKGHNTHKIVAICWASFGTGAAGCEIDHECFNEAVVLEALGNVENEWQQLKANNYDNATFRRIKWCSWYAGTIARGYAIEANPQAETHVIDRDMYRRAFLYVKENQPPDPSPFSLGRELVKRRKSGSATSTNLGVLC